MKKVFFLDTVHPVLEERLTGAGYLCIDVTKVPIQELKIMLSDAIGIVIRSRITLNQNILSSCPKIKFIARSGAGLENIDLQYCKKNNIVVYNSPEGNRNAVAEHCIGFLFSLLNNFKQAEKDLNNRYWLREKNRGIEINGLCVGIIGYGNNGRAFAERLSDLGAKVLVYDRYKKNFSKGRIKESSMDEIFKEASVISFHVPLNTETTYMADYQFFSSFKKPVWVLNISRGKVLKTKDLIKALNDELVLGAALDVLDEESKSFDIQEINELLIDLNKRTNVVLTPHVAGWTKESYFKLSNVLADKILK
jgi:D-3-phosphoglycerate dehydrogenase